MLSLIPQACPYLQFWLIESGDWERSGNVAVASSYITAFSVLLLHISTWWLSLQTTVTDKLSYHIKSMHLHVRCHSDNLSKLSKITMRHTLLKIYHLEKISLSTRSACFCEQKTKVKLKLFQATTTNRLWQFMWNTCQPWNQDLVACLCTGGVEVVIAKWHLCW